MDLPHDLRLSLERELRSYDPRSLARVTAEAAARYRDPTAGPPPRGPLAAAAYAATRMPATYAACTAALRELAARLPAFAPRSLLDAGAGSGATLWAAALIWPALERATLIETDRDIAALGQRLAATATAPVVRGAVWVRADLTAAWDAPTHDLVTAAYVLGELPENARASLVTRLWERAHGALVLIEPGTPRGWATIRAAREQLRATGAALIAPCPHQDACPLPADDWCHFSQRLARGRLHRTLKGAELGYEDEKYAYIAVARQAGEAIGARVLRHPLIRSGYIELTLCTPDGIRRLSVTRSAGATWRMARDLRWGDTLPPEVLNDPQPPARDQGVARPEQQVKQPMAHWTFLTNHAQVLLCIARNRSATAREIATQVGITERAVQRILRDLHDAGYISHTRDGRQNRYEIHEEAPMRHPAQQGHAVRELLELLD